MKSCILRAPSQYTLPFSCKNPAPLTKHPQDPVPRVYSCPPCSTCHQVRWLLWHRVHFSLIRPLSCNQLCSDSSLVIGLVARRRGGTNLEGHLLLHGERPWTLNPLVLGERQGGRVVPALHGEGWASSAGSEYSGSLLGSQMVGNIH